VEKLYLSWLAVPRRVARTLPLSAAAQPPLTARCTAHAHRSPPHSPQTLVAVRSRGKLTFVASPAPSVYPPSCLRVLPPRSLGRSLAGGKVRLWTRWSSTELVSWDQQGRGGELEQAVAQRFFRVWNARVYRWPNGPARPVVGPARQARLAKRAVPDGSTCRYRKCKANKTDHSRQHTKHFLMSVVHVCV
jgi:hypothetical protein